ncbi:MAG TPA: hypothetical protein VFE72_10400 [Lysobacter sp.]|nr:hypothetical protein [Lysobacter sp.]
MEAYGFLEDGEQAIRLSAASFALTPEAMRSFAAFVAHAAAEMEQLGANYDHVHWQDRDDWNPTWPDIQLTKVYLARSAE